MVITFLSLCLVSCVLCLLSLSSLFFLYYFPCLFQLLYLWNRTRAASFFSVWLSYGCGALEIFELEELWGPVLLDPNVANGSRGVKREGLIGVLEWREIVELTYLFLFLFLVFWQQLERLDAAQVEDE